MRKRVKNIIVAGNALNEVAPIEHGPEAQLAQLCPQLPNWPRSWRYDETDLPAGERLAACFKAFLLYLLAQDQSPRTVRKHCTHVWMLGGEIIRRLQNRPHLRRRPAQAIVLEFIDPSGGPLIWPRITEQQQEALDATCRKLYKYLADYP